MRSQVISGGGERGSRALRGGERRARRVENAPLAERGPQRSWGRGSEGAAAAADARTSGGGAAGASWTTRILGRGRRARERRDPARARRAGAWLLRPRPGGEQARAPEAEDRTGERDRGRPVTPMRVAIAAPDASPPPADVGASDPAPPPPLDPVGSVEPPAPPPEPPPSGPSAPAGSVIVSRARTLSCTPAGAPPRVRSAVRSVRSSPSSSEKDSSRAPRFLTPNRERQSRPGRAADANTPWRAAHRARPRSPASRTLRFHA